MDADPQMPAEIRQATVNETQWFLQRSRAPRLRTMREFAEAEIIIPDGPFKGLKFNCDRQPYTRLLFDAIDSGHWTTFACGGPTQSGKSHSAYVTPTLYHLFEVGETVVCGLPSMEMAADKWQQDILPTIEASRYRDLINTHGAGSKGGTPESIQFLNGATLRFMSGGGSDKKRAGFTTRVVVITEVDGMDTAGGKSREADKITQIIGRTLSYGQRKRVYLECTFSVVKGRIYVEVTNGTNSRIFLLCPHCKTFIHPTRSDLLGWQGCATELEAAANAAIYCSACGEAWSEADRRAAHLVAKLVHRGQEIDPAGNITGELPETTTLGFRWDAVNNFFRTMAEIGAAEWKASRADDEENAEKEMRQFVWALPHAPSEMDSTPLEVDAIIKRTAFGPRGFIPRETTRVAVHIDVGKWLCHWSAIAFRPDGGSHIFDYGVQEVATRQLGEEKAIMQALLELGDAFDAGWHDRKPDAVWVDAGYQQDTIFAFIRQKRGVYLPTKGLGSSLDMDRDYKRPKTTGAQVKLIGEGWHFAALPTEKVLLAEVHADHWKSYAHKRLTTPLDKPGAMTLFQASPQEHLSFAKHVTAERQVEEFVAGEGTVVKWVRDRRANHWFDTVYNCCAAGNFLGIRLIKEAPQAVAAATPPPPR